MRNLGKFLCDKKDKIHFYDNLLESMAYNNDENLFDVVYCSFVLEELKTPEERILTINTLWERVKKNGFAIFVLPGSPMGFRFQNDLRDLFI